VLAPWILALVAELFERFAGMDFVVVVVVWVVPVVQVQAGMMWMLRLEHLCIPNKFLHGMEPKSKSAPHKIPIQRVKRVRKVPLRSRHFLATFWEIPK
jgi:hypothetical protein